MGIVVSVMGLLVTLALAVLAKLIADDFKEWRPWIIEKVTGLAVTFLIPEQRERYREEWQSHANDMPGELAKVLVALDSVRAALHIRATVSIQALFNGKSQAPVVPVPDSVIYCQAPVAMLLHRVMAWVIDASMILSSILAFVAVLHLAGVEIVLNKRTVPLYGVVFAGIVTVYRCLWCAANMDSLGLRWSGLTLMNFDGTFPEPKQRWQRMIASYISLMAGGLGLLWGLADEEKLTWHDYMSRTFPTPRSKPPKYSYYL